MSPSLLNAEISFTIATNCQMIEILFTPTLGQNLFQIEFLIDNNINSEGFIQIVDGMLNNFVKYNPFH